MASDKPTDSAILHQLAEVLEARKHGDADASYVAGLYAQGRTAILQKVGEEAVETILAGQGNDDQHLVDELADLWFHCLVLLAERGLGPDEVLQELARRFGLSGLTEKAARETH